MGDPVSVAGTAVGIVSLGIQLCEKLGTYASNVKDAKIKVEQAGADMDMLANYLELLETVVVRLDPNACTEGTRVGIQACANALDKIKKELQKASIKGNQTFRQQMQDVKQRLMYHFREGKIEYCKRIVESVQRNLQVALAALQM